MGWLEPLDWNRGSGSIVGLGLVGETSSPGLVVDPELDIGSGSIRRLG